ncbi:MAG: DUF2934 domain-containing protein [Chitinispirillales bacterium]|nr:DUF2934 domain-containing protein [Chitinispirillales bacterium]
MSTKPLSELIAERAYEVYQKRVRNGVPGDQHSDWAQAEREVTEELKKKGAAAPKAPEPKPVPVFAPRVESKPEVREPPKPAAPKAEEKAPPKVEPKPVAAPPVKTVVAKKAVKK